MLRTFFLGAAVGSIVTVAVVQLLRGFQPGHLSDQRPSRFSALGGLDFVSVAELDRLDQQVTALEQESDELSRELSRARERSTPRPTSAVRWRTAPLQVRAPPAPTAPPPTPPPADDCALRPGDQIELVARAVELREDEGSRAWAATLEAWRSSPAPRYLLAQGRASGKLSSSLALQEGPPEPSAALGLALWGLPEAWALGPLLELPAGSWRSYRVRVLLGMGVGLGSAAPAQWVAQLGLVVGR